MIPWLVPWFAEHWQPSQVLGYITVRAALAAGVAFATALLLGKSLIARLETLNVYEKPSFVPEKVSRRDDRNRVVTKGVAFLEEFAAHKKAKKLPTFGGVFWVAAVLFSTILFARLNELLVLLGATLLVGMGAIGFYDDWVKYRSKEGRSVGLSRTAKLVSSVLLVVWVVGLLWLLGRESGRAELGIIYFPILKDLTADPALLGGLGFLLFVVFESFVILAASHAVNITDGLDGLAAGSALPAFGALCVSVYVVSNAVWAEYLHLPFLPGAGEVAVMGGALVGATLGFLWFNSSPSEIILGDSGALPMGAMIAWLAIVSRQEFALPLLAGVFVLEAASSFMQIYWFKVTRKFFGGGKRLFPVAPFHHVFMMKVSKDEWDVREPKVVVRFWILAAVLAAFGLLALKVR